MNDDMNKTTRQIKAEQTRLRLLVALEKLLADNSLADLTIRDICSEANVSVGSFYVYFQNKEEALLALHKAGNGPVDYKMLRYDPMTNIQTLISNYFKHVLKQDPGRVRDLYCSHLRYYDEFFIGDSFPVTKCIYKELGKIIDDAAAHELSHEIVDFTRGKIYNYCISFADYSDEWIEKSIDQTITYLKMLMEQREQRKS